MPSITHDVLQDLLATQGGSGKECTGSAKAEYGPPADTDTDQMLITLECDGDLDDHDLRDMRCHLVVTACAEGYRATAIQVWPREVTQGRVESALVVSATAETPADALAAVHHAAADRGMVYPWPVPAVEAAMTVLPHETHAEDNQGWTTEQAPEAEPQEDSA